MTGVLAQRCVKHDVDESVHALSDGNLLERYLTGPDGGGPGCLSGLGGSPRTDGAWDLPSYSLHEEHEAEDAFQATFLVLAQKGSTIRNRTVLAGWLHEVAHRIAIKARVSVVRRRTLERQAMAMSPPRIEPGKQDEAAAWNELRPVLHAEVDRFPEKYRLPVILCYFEGKTNEEVAGPAALAGRIGQGSIISRSGTVAVSIDAARAGPFGRIPDDGPFAGQSFRRDRAGRAGQQHGAPRSAVRPSPRGPQPALSRARQDGRSRAPGSARPVARSGCTDIPGKPVLDLVLAVRPGPIDDGRGRACRYDAWRILGRSLGTSLAVSHQ